MATDTVLNELILQEVTQAEYEQLEKDNLLDENRVYLTPDNSLKGSLFDFKWADHLLNDISWLRADTFSWQSGDVYVAAYNHLAEDVNKIQQLSVVVNGTAYYKWKNQDNVNTYWTLSATPAIGDTVYSYSDGGMSSTRFVVVEIGANNIRIEHNATGDTYWAEKDFTQTDTIGDITISYYLAEDGHKICLPDQEDKLLELYNKTGVAWYYILDTENKQFKLPRSKHNKYANTLGVVGNGMTLGLTDGRTDFGTASTQFGTNEYPIVKTLNQGNVGESFQYYADTGNGLMGVSTDPEKSGLIAQQEQDTDQYKYLYFYVGNFERDAVEQTAGVTAETLSGKADIDLSNAVNSASQIAKETIIAWGIPDYSAGIAFTLNKSTSYTALKDGFVIVYTNRNQDLYSNIKIDEIVVADHVSYWSNIPHFFPVAKGAVISTDYDTIESSVFYPFKGVN